MSLLLIPGPIEVSPAVLEAAAVPPPSHLAPDFIATFAAALRDMRRVWRATDAHQPFVVAGSGTLAMEIAVTNLLEPGQRAIVVQTGYFSDRMAEMLRRRGVAVTMVEAAPGSAPSEEAVAAALSEGEAHALFATHVDTSTGVRTDAEALCRLAREAGALSVFDGVCATAGERFEQAAWGADVYLTASQKAIGLPPGLALLVASPRAMEARRALSTPPPMSVDWLEWLPIHQAYEEGRPAYFSTPATTLVPALAASLAEMLAVDPDPTAAMEARFALHARTAAAFRAAWSALGLSLVPDAGLEADTLSAVRFPDGVGPDLVGRIKARGVVVAGGLHPAIKPTYFRVGHMGHVLTQPERLAGAVGAIGEALVEAGHRCDPEGAVAAFRGALG